MVKQKVKTKAKKTAKKSAPKESSSTLSAYSAALTAPFSENALGARVPDYFSVPTKTVHLTRRCAMVTNASGEGDLLILPSAYCHAVSSRGSISGGVTWSLLDGTTVANGMLSTSPTNTSAQITNYRIVGYGVRIMGVASMTNNAGIVIAAKVPISSWVNSKTDTVGGLAANTTNSGATMNNTLKSYGVPAYNSNVDIGVLPTLPNSLEVSMIGVSERPLEILPKVSSSEAFNFRLSNDSAIGFSITDQTSLSYVQSGDASYLRLGGHEAVIIGLSGCANNTSVVEVEIIYHLEGIPTLGPSVYLAADSVKAAVDPVSWFQTLKKAASAPAFRQLTTSVLNSVYPGLGSLSQKFY